MDAFQGYRFPVDQERTKVSAGATNEEIEIGPVPSGHIWVITNLAIENETTLFTSFRAGIRGGGKDHWLIEDYSLAADRLYWWDGSLYLSEGRRLVLRYTGTTANDVLRAFVNGFDVIQPQGAKYA